MKQQQETISWVPVSDSLPRYGTEYMVSIRGGETGCALFWPSTGKFVRNTDDITRFVTAWSLMPRGYRPEEG